MKESLKDSKNRGKGIGASLIFHAILLLIMFFYSFKVERPDPDPAEQPNTVLVELDMPIKKYTPPPPVKEPELEKFDDMEETSNSTKANADKGESRPKNPEVQKVEVNDPKPPASKVETPEPPKPAPTPPAPSGPVKTPIVTKEESPVKVKETDIEVDKPSRDPVPSKSNGSSTPNTTPSPTTNTPKRSEDTGRGTVGSPNGTGDKPQSNTDGNGRGKSDSGTGLGSDKGNDVTSGTGNSSDGTGEYDGSGNGIFNRKVIYKNYAALPMTQSGKIVVKTCIDRAGLVTYAEIMQLESTIKDRAVLKKTLSAARGYKFEPSKTAPKEQCGKLIINLDINLFR